MMTVSELVLALSSYPGDAKIAVTHAEGVDFPVKVVQSNVNPTLVYIVCPTEEEV